MQEVCCCGKAVTRWRRWEEVSRLCSIREGGTQGVSHASEAWLRHQKIVLPFRGTFTGWSHESRAALCCSAEGNAKSCSWEEQPHALVDAGVQLLNATLQKRTWGILVGTKVDMSQKYASASALMVSWAVLGRVVTAVWGCCTWCWSGHTWSVWSCSGLPYSIFLQCNAFLSSPRKL